MLGRWKCIGAILSACAADKKGPAPEGAGPKRFAEPVAVSSTEPSDFPILALADRLVQPCGSASTYFRAALGALVNLGGRQASCKWVPRRKIRILRRLNNQHFHSGLCNLWKSGGRPRSARNTRARILRLDITPVLVHAPNRARRGPPTSSQRRPPGSPRLPYTAA